MRLLPILFVSASVSGCGLDEVGVLSVRVTLEATEPSELPAELDGLIDLETLHAAAGTAEADVVEGRLTIDATLVDPPEGWVWVPSLTVEHDERAGLPGAHGDDGHGGEDEGPDTLMMTPLAAVGEDSWSAIYVRADLDGKPLGGLRGAMVMLMPEDAAMDGPSLMVLAGEASFDQGAEAPAEPEEEEGHSHGV